MKSKMKAKIAFAAAINRIDPYSFVIERERDIEPIREWDKLGFRHEKQKYKKPPRKI